MKHTFTAALFLPILMLLPSCDGRSGCIDEDRQNIVDLLTGADWLVEYADYGPGGEQTYDDTTTIYSFGKDLKGWRALGSFKDPAVKENVQYFQWTFTTENYAVIHTAGNSADGYWLIQKLTPTALWLQWSAKDPVLIPNQTTTHYRLIPRAKQYYFL